MGTHKKQLNTMIMAINLKTVQWKKHEKALYYKPSNELKINGAI